VSEAISKAIGAMEWMMVDYEHLNVIGDSLSANWVLRVQAVKDAIAALQAMQGEPVYAFRRKGLIDFCTCDKRRYLELKEKPTIFEFAIFYTDPQPAVPEGALAMSDRNIAGALFDFLGFLTTLEKSVSLGVSELATPAVDLLTEWAKTRGLGLDDADVSGWHSALQHAGQGEARPTASEYLLAADKILSGKKVYTQSGERVTRTPQPAVPEGYVPVPRAAVTEVLRISDRQHPAWDAVKAALLSAGKETV
jgi:hypothetical protein